MKSDNFKFTLFLGICNTDKICKLDVAHLSKYDYFINNLCNE